LTAVKVEPHTSDEETFKQAAVNHRTKRFNSSSSASRHADRDDSSDDGGSLHIGLDCVDNFSEIRFEAAAGNVARNTKRRRCSKDTRTPGQPGLTAGVFVGMLTGTAKHLPLSVLTAIIQVDLG